MGKLHKTLTSGVAALAVSAVMAASPALAIDESTPGAQKAVSLMEAWVAAGAPNGAFTYTDLAGNKADGTFDADILPLMTTDNIWGDDLPACTSCHTGLTEESLHEMDLTSYKGMMAGADSLANPPGVSLFGEKKPGDGHFDWGHSKMKQRLRDNRMPPGIEFDITESNRDGPCLDAKGNKTGEYSECEISYVSVMADWAAAGAKNDDTFKNVILKGFTTDDYFGEGLPACTSCHTGLTEESLHEMDLTSYEGLMAGADSLGNPPGVSLLANSHDAKTPGAPIDFGHSKMRARLRDNRMPPGIEFDITEENRDGPIVLHGKR